MLAKEVEEERRTWDAVASASSALPRIDSSSTDVFFPRCTRFFFRFRRVHKKLARGKIVGREIVCEWMKHMRNENTGLCEEGKRKCNQEARKQREVQEKRWFIGYVKYKDRDPKKIQSIQNKATLALR